MTVVLLMCISDVCTSPRVSLVTVWFNVNVNPFHLSRDIMTSPIMWIMIV